MTYGLHKYWVMNDGEVIHDDFMNEHVDESNDFTWPNTAYTIDADKLPLDLLHADDEVIGPFILAYHKKESPKPDWIVE